MGFKKRNKISAQFNMSSLTDIIFLLLIFFMLTSTLVAPHALNLKLPGQTTAKVTPSDAIPQVDIRRDGNYLWKGSRVSYEQLEGRLKELSRGPSSKRSFTIAPHKQTPVEHVVAVMDAAMRYRLNAILLPEK